MSMHSDPEQPVAASTSDAGILLDQPRVLGVDPLDPSGTLPADARLNGITVIIPQWPNFPTGVQVHTVDIYIVGIINAVAQRSYRAADVAPEFFIPIPAALLPVTPSFEIFYNVRTPNPTTSPIRRLTFRVAPAARTCSPHFSRCHHLWIHKLQQGSKRTSRSGCIICLGGYSDIDSI